MTHGYGLGVLCLCDCEQERISNNLQALFSRYGLLLVEP
jgi:hypothetical protein